MADPSQYRPPTSQIPTNPGVYRFSDENGVVIYVGKAKNLRSRLVNYFQDLSQLHPRTQRMVTSAASVQWTVVQSEIEALTLEFQWIKEFNPRFNVLYKDDKSYPYLAVSLSEKYPRVRVTRDAKRKGERYFGPYTQVWAIRESIDLLLRVFPMRTCSPGVFRRAVAQKRACLYGDIGKCAAPCIGRISENEHRKLAEELCRFMDGKAGPILRDLETRMKEASKQLNFEEAARLRDDLKALNTVLEKNTIVLDDGSDADVFALAADDLDAAVYAFYVRGGRVRGTRGFVINREDDADENTLMARLLEQIYGGIPVVETGARTQLKEAPKSVDDIEHTSTQVVPKEILVNVLPEGCEALTQWLGERRGAKVAIRIPERGAKSALLATVRANALESLQRHKITRAGDITHRSRALEELAEYLDLTQAPLRIECYDISHTQGTHQVGSMVVFEDGIPRKDAYRHFTIRGVDGQGATDDTAAMGEVLRRRFARLLAEERGHSGFDDDGVLLQSGPIDPATGKAKRFSYRPDLVVVDGGLPQVRAAANVLENMGIDIPLIGLAKRLEEVWIPDDSFPVILPRSSSGLYLLQHLRDESHRFAITAHRAKRAGAQTRSVLDAIPGLGPRKAAALLKYFGSVKRIKAATTEDLQSVSGIGPKMAGTILKHLNSTLTQ